MILLDLTKQELQEFFVQNLDAKKFVADQVFAWLNKGATFDQMTNVSLALRQKLSQIAIDQPIKIVQTLTSKIDGTQKFLYQLHDGNIIEGVLMQYKYGNTLCVSTQVGCRMGCKFCASTIGGLVRNLSAGEILGQVVAVNALGKGERFVTNVVLMGSGEPLDNYDNVIKFLRLVGHEKGLNIGYRHISLSTCGIVTGIEKLAKTLGTDTHTQLAAKIEKFCGNGADVLKGAHRFVPCDFVRTRGAFNACSAFFIGRIHRHDIETTEWHDSFECLEVGVDGGEPFAEIVEFDCFLHGCFCHNFYRPYVDFITIYNYTPRFEKVKSF